MTYCKDCRHEGRFHALFEWHRCNRCPSRGLDACYQNNWANFFSFDPVVHSTPQRQPIV